jgi:hypothetical protein
MRQEPQCGGNPLHSRRVGKVSADIQAVCDWAYGNGSWLHMREESNIRGRVSTTNKNYVGYSIGVSTVVEYLIAPPPGNAT